MKGKIQNPAWSKVSIVKDDMKSGVKYIINADLQIFNVDHGGGRTPAAIRCEQFFLSVVSFFPSLY